MTEHDAGERPDPMASAAMADDAAKSTTVDDNIDKAAEEASAAADGAPPVEPAVDKRSAVPYDVAFRLSVYYDVDKGRYGVRCDELGDLEVSGATRADALREGEAMLESKIAAYAVKGETLPKPFDFELPVDYSGHLEIQISRSLHRDLALAARRDRLAIEKLCVELLARGVEARSRGFRSDRPDDRPPRERRDNDPDRGRRGMSRDRYQHVMEDKAAFLEYVRSMDQNQGNSGGRGGRGGGDRGGGGGGRNWRNR